MLIYRDLLGNKISFIVYLSLSIILTHSLVAELLFFICKELFRFYKRLIIRLLPALQVYRNRCSPDSE